ncbi:hypothetical protein CSPAE12_02414 [Colletotrichum incanum]|nr:hypothetical protein CSPAE12_02414 [Colletotrichum incanum]
MLVVKTINDTAGLNGIIFTLLIFSAYPYITNNSALSLNILYKDLLKTIPLRLTAYPYYKDLDIIALINVPPNEDANINKNIGNNHAKDTIVITTSPRSPVAITIAPPACRPYGRLRKTLPLNVLLQETNVPNYLSPNYSSAFVSTKEESNKALTV